jgi:drug/metabolite transporter (DMT)-like permease
VLGTDFVYHPSLNLGNLLGLTSSLFYAAYYLVTQRGRRKLSALQYTYIMTLSSGSANLLISLVSGAPIFGYDGPTYLAFLGAGILTQAIGFLSLSYALGRISAPLVSATMIVQPVLSAVLAIPILGETLSTGQWIGGLAVLAGIYLVNRSQEPSPQNALPANDANSANF